MPVLGSVPAGHRRRRTTKPVGDLIAAPISRRSLPIRVGIEVQRKLAKGVVRSRTNKLTHQRPRLDRNFEEAELTRIAVAVLVVFNLRRVALRILKRPRGHGREWRRLRSSRLAVTLVGE